MKIRIIKLREYNPERELYNLMKDIELMRRYDHDKFEDILMGLDLDENRRRYKELLAEAKKYFYEE